MELTPKTPPHKEEKGVRHVKEVFVTIPRPKREPIANPGHEHIKVFYPSDEERVKGFIEAAKRDLEDFFDIKNVPEGVVLEAKSIIQARMIWSAGYKCIYDGEPFQVDISVRGKDEEIAYYEDVTIFDYLNIDR